MKVSIVGAGNMGRGVAHRALAGGNEVELVEPDPEDVEALAEALAEAFVERGGMTAVDAGPLRMARPLEQVGRFRSTFQEMIGSSFASAVVVHW